MSKNILSLSLFIIVIIFFSLILFDSISMTANFYLQKDDFNEIKKIYSKKWSNFIYCQNENGEKVINNISFLEKNKKILSEFSKASKKINAKVDESYFKKAFQIEGANCFFGESDYFLVQTDKGAMDYYIGYAYFNKGKSTIENEKKLYESNVYLLRQGSKYKLTGLNDNWYIYEFIH